MCGLAGIAGDTNIRLRDAFMDLLDITRLRGRDSTGVFTVTKGGEVRSAKTLGTPDFLYDTKAFDQTMHGVPKIMAGHCRSKTIGENSRSNAHPYEFDTLVGMHNGTLKAYYQMEGYNHKTTDSYALYYDIDKHGVQEAVKNIDPDGAWALVWYNKEDERLYFLRNEKRPLWFAWTKDRTAMVWCSEPWMFSAVSRLVDLWDGKEEGKADVSPYFQLPPNQLWSFTVNGYSKPGERYLTFHQPHELKAEGKKQMGFSNTYSARGGEVTNPFFGVEDDGTFERYMLRNGYSKSGRETLDDPINDVGTTASQGGSTTSTPSASKSGTTSSNVLDFRQGQTHGKSSSKSTLSLPQKSSVVTQPNSNAKQTDSSMSCCEMTHGNVPSSHSFPRVDLRTVASTPYISHKLTSSEISLDEFERRTGGKCSYCHQPIGDLSEVAAFTDKAMSGFVCTACLVEPKVAVTG